MNKWLIALSVFLLGVVIWMVTHNPNNNVIREMPILSTPKEVVRNDRAQDNLTRVIDSLKSIDAHEKIIYKDRIAVIRDLPDATVDSLFAARMDSMWEYRFSKDF